MYYDNKLRYLWPPEFRNHGPFLKVFPIDIWDLFDAEFQTEEDF